MAIRQDSYLNLTKTPTSAPITNADYMNIAGGIRRFVGMADDGMMSRSAAVGQYFKNIAGFDKKQEDQKKGKNIQLLREAAVMAQSSREPSMLGSLSFSKEPTVINRTRLTFPNLSDLPMGMGALPVDSFQSSGSPMLQGLVPASATVEGAPIAGRAGMPTTVIMSPDNTREIQPAYNPDNIVSRGVPSWAAMPSSSSSSVVGDIFKNIFSPDVLKTTADVVGKQLQSRGIPSPLAMQQVGLQQQPGVPAWAWVAGGAAILGLMAVIALR